MTREILQLANQHSQLSRVFTTWSSNVPQLTLTVDRDRAALLDVPVAQIFSSLQTAFGGTRAGDFSRNNRVYHVVMQNEMQWRERAEQISELYVRSRDGERVRLAEQSGHHYADGGGAVYSAVQSVPVRVGERFSGRGGQQPHGDGGHGADFAGPSTAGI